MLGCLPVPRNVRVCAMSHVLAKDLINVMRIVRAKDMEMSTDHVIVKELVNVINFVHAKVLELKDYHPELRSVQGCVMDPAVVKDQTSVTNYVHAKVMER